MLPELSVFNSREFGFCFSVDDNGTPIWENQKEKEKKHNILLFTEKLKRKKVECNEYLFAWSCSDSCRKD